MRVTWWPVTASRNATISSVALLIGRHKAEVAKPAPRARRPTTMPESVARANGFAIGRIAAIRQHRRDPQDQRTNCGCTPRRDPQPWVAPIDLRVEYKHGDRQCHSVQDQMHREERPRAPGRCKSRGDRFSLFVGRLAADQKRGRHHHDDQRHRLPEVAERIAIRRNRQALGVEEQKGEHVLRDQQRRPKPPPRDGQLRCSGIAVREIDVHVPCGSHGGATRASGGRLAWPTRVDARAGYETERMCAIAHARPASPLFTGPTIDDRNRGSRATPPPG